MGIVQSTYKAFTDFRSKAGSYVFWASILSKLLTFLASWVAIQIVDSEELGHAIYAFTIVAFLIPFAGAGLFQSLLRFGARLNSEEEKHGMLMYCLKFGLIASAVLASILFICSDFIVGKMPESGPYLKWFALMLFTSFLFELSKVQHRILHNNRKFARTDMFYAIMLAVLMALLTSMYGARGYAWAFILSPLIAAIDSSRSLLNIDFKGLTIIAPVKKMKFWSYGIFSSLGNVTTELLIAIDIILIGNLLLDATAVTAYKYVTLLPFSLLFLSHVYMSTHFVTLAERMEDRTYIKKFIRNYLVIFAGIIVLIAIGSWFLGAWFLSLFSESYRQYFEVFMILVVGTAGVLLIRGLFGNLLSAIGKAQANFFISSLALLLNIALNYSLIPEYGIKGAALTSATVMWFTALLSAGVFYYYYKLSVVSD